MPRHASASKEEVARITAEAKLRQRAYAAHRRAWARSVGRPYTRDHDHRPPPGELDAGPDE